MKLNNPEASLFIPDAKSIEEAAWKITHLGIGAHQDDVEIMAFHGILQCYHSADFWFGAVTCTNGSESPRAGKYASFTDMEMVALRSREQEKAAIIGNYSLLVQLNYTSAAVRKTADPAVRNDIISILKACRPRIVYTHNLADKHETHLAVGLTVLQAIRELPEELRPETVYGCEVWRALDWMSDEDKIPLDVSEHENLAAALVGIYDSQVAGGKRYDLATLGRRRANASYFHCYQADKAEQLWFAMDLTPLAHDESLDIKDYVIAFIEKFRKDVETKIAKYAGKSAGR